jgi:hypothetical protein
MHDEIRTGPPCGHALSIPHCREAQKKITLSFRDQKAAIRPGRRIQLPLKRPLDAGIGDHWFNFGGVWTVRMEGSRIVFPALEKTIA